MITISQKMFPFSHKPGTCFLIPASPFEVEVFPALTRIYDLSGLERKLVKEVSHAIQGPLSHFLVLQDLERGCIQVWREGVVQYILPDLQIVEEKKSGLSLPSSFEKLSLGSHKKLEWEKILERGDFVEIFPLWHRLGTLLVLPKMQRESGMFSLLTECRQAIFQNPPEHLLANFKRLFLAGFRPNLIPRLHDTDYQGIANHEGGDQTPLYLLTEGAKLIRSLFVGVNEKSIEILPHLPPQFHAGRFLHIDCKPFGTLSLEWTKKSIRRCVFESCYEGVCHFQFRSHVKEFRLRNHEREKGRIHFSSEPMEIKSGTLYLLDRFQK